MIKKHIKECLKLDTSIKFGKIIGNYQQVFLDSGKEVFFHLNEDKTDIDTVWYYNKEDINLTVVQLNKKMIRGGYNFRNNL